MANFSILPSEIMLDIFTRLPAGLVLECKSVSKTLKNVVEHPCFSKLHFNHLNDLDSGKVSFIFLLNDAESDSIQFYYAEYDENASDTPTYRVKKMTYKPPSECYSLVGSCNGLICLNGLPAHFTHDDYDEFDPASNVAYVCNPITRETVMLPELKRRSCHDDRVDFLVIGFGYVRSTDEYKVVRLYKFMREPKFAQIEVYTLGSRKGWRDDGKKIETGLGGWQHGVFANGCIYWNFGNGKIVAFDLADEMFVELSECPIFRCRRIRLGVFGDHLCATNSDTITNISDVWLLKKHKDESLMSWSKELSLTNMDGYDTPLAVTGSAKLLCHSNTSLYLYDLKSASSKLLANFGRCFHQVIPHRNTLVSIDSITRENSKSLESGEKVQ